MVARYDRGVRALLPRRALVLGVFAVLVARDARCSSAPCPTGFLPDEDQGYFITSFQLPDGASLERTDEVAQRGRAASCSDTPGIVGMNLFGGFDALTGTFPPNFGSVFVTLAPWDERGAKGQSLDAIFAHVRPAARGDPGRARLRAEPGADPRPLAHRRLRVPAPGPRRRHARASSRR